MIVDRVIRDVPLSSTLFSTLNDVTSTPIEGRVFVAIFSSPPRSSSTMTLEDAALGPELDSGSELDLDSRLDSDLDLDSRLDLDFDSEPGSEPDARLYPPLVS